MFRVLMPVAVATLLTGSVQAATLNTISIAAQDTAPDYTLIDSGNNTFTLSWTAEPNSIFVEFNVSGDFNLALDSFGGTDGGARFQLRNENGSLQTFSTAPSGFSGGGTSTSGLDGLSAGLDVDSVNTDDDFSIGGGNLRIEAGSSGIMFEGLTAGTYFLGMRNVGNPINTSAVFSVSAVPIPAAGVLFGSALLGAAFLRRRSIQSKLGMPTA